MDIDMKELCKVLALALALLVLATIGIRSLPKFRYEATLLNGDTVTVNGMPNTERSGIETTDNRIIPYTQVKEVREIREE